MVWCIRCHGGGFVDRVSEPVAGVGVFVSKVMYSLLGLMYLLLGLFYPLLGLVYPLLGLVYPLFVSVCPFLMSLRLVYPCWAWFLRYSGWGTRSLGFVLNCLFLVYVKITKE